MENWITRNGNILTRNGQVVVPKPIIYQKGYGYLYNWWVTQEEVTSSAEWGVPTVQQYTDLFNLAGGISIAGKLKSVRTSPTAHPRWTSPNTSAEGLFNINMLPNGWRSTSGGDFTLLGTNTQIWTSTESSATQGTWVDLNYLYSYGTIVGSGGTSSKIGGRSIRAVRNATGTELLLDDGAYCTDYIGNDGKRYKTVKISTLVWTVQNLAETKYRNGTLIPFENVVGQGNYSMAEWRALTTPARCAYSNNETYVTIDY